MRAVLLLLLLVTDASGHLTTVCTSTAPSQCEDSRLIFWLGTYHSPTRPSGEVIITMPSGDSVSFDFTSRCAVQSSYFNGPCPGEDILQSCQGDDLPPDSHVQCFAYDPSSGRAYPVDNTCNAMAGSYPYDSVRTQYKAVIRQPRSGLYTVTMRGTDVNLDPCDEYRTPQSCSSLPTSMGGETMDGFPRSYVFPLTIASCGGHCFDAPPAIAHAVPSSFAQCIGKFSGYVCSYACSDSRMATVRV